MKFGHIDDISQIDFSLPPDNPMTAKVLKGKPAKKVKVFSGCPTWGEKEFVGTIYPKGTKAKDFLKIYATQFNAIELNATGYRIPPMTTVEEWKKSVPAGFVFCPKVSLPISGVRPLGKNAHALHGFCDAMHALGEHFGAAFLQLHPNFAPERFEDLVHFCDIWDTSLPLHIELRHPGWFSNPELLTKLFEEMRQRKIGTVLTDTAGRRDAMHQCLTTTTAFIRFDGNELHPTDFPRIDEWAQRVSTWIANGLETVYFFAHTSPKHLNPQLSNHFLEQMNAVCGLELKLARIEARP